MGIEFTVLVTSVAALAVAYVWRKFANRYRRWGPSRTGQVKQTPWSGRAGGGTGDDDLLLWGTTYHRTVWTPPQRQLALVVLGDKPRRSKALRFMAVGLALLNARVLLLDGWRERGGRGSRRKARLGSIAGLSKVVASAASCLRNEGGDSLSVGVVGLWGAGSAALLAAANGAIDGPVFALGSPRVPRPPTAVLGREDIYLVHAANDHRVPVNEFETNARNWGVPRQRRLLLLRGGRRFVAQETVVVAQLALWLARWTSVLPTPAE
ncbi:MAG: hypothetical protein Kow0069_24500 [Promethearchaeota archaeon]